VSTSNILIPSLNPQSLSNNLSSVFIGYLLSVIILAVSTALLKGEDIRVRYADKKVLVVAHSAVLRGMHYIINGIPEDGDMSKIDIPNLRIIEYEI